VELIRREASILKELKHLLIIELREQIDSQHNSVLLTEFAGNGSLAQSPSSDANRIALAMRFVHSRGIIHCDLKPDNIVLDWDWKVRIADFSQSIAPDNPDIHRLTHEGWPSIDSRYLAPECYDNHYSSESDVFAFGLILYELLTGQPVVSKSLTKWQILHKIVINGERPEIPESVPPDAEDLITDCWARKTRDRPSFEKIVDRLEEVKFKVCPNVNSRKLSAFVKEIKEWEKQNADVPE
jgi:serine/threonine protein kinase